MANDYMTPGSAVADQLQQILTSRRLEARQAQQDQINRLNLESQIRDRDENTNTNREYRLGLAENRKANAQRLQEQADEKRLATVMPGQIEDPSTANFLQSKFPNLMTAGTGPTLPSTQMTGSSSLPTTDGSAPAPVAGLQVANVPSRNDLGSFKGTPAYQQQVKRQMDLEDVGKHLSTMKPEEQIMAIAKLYPNSDPAAILERLLTAKNQQGPGRILIMDEATGKVTDSATGQPAGPKGPNDVIEKRTRAPREPRGPAPVFMTGANPDGTPHVGFVNPLEPIPDWVTRKGNEAAGGAKPVVSAAEGYHLSTLKGKAAVTPPGPLGRLFGSSGTQPKQADKDAYEQERRTVISRFSAPVQSAINGVLSEDARDPELAKISTEQVIAQQTAGLDPKTAAEFATALRLVRGE